MHKKNRVRVRLTGHSDVKPDAIGLNLSMLDWDTH